MGRQTTSKRVRKFAPKLKGEIEKRRERQKIHQQRHKRKNKVTEAAVKEATAPEQKHNEVRVVHVSCLILCSLLNTRPS